MISDIIFLLLFRIQVRNTSRSPIFTQIGLNVVSFHICINSLTFVFLCPFIFHQGSDDFPESWNFDHKSYNMIHKIQKNLSILLFYNLLVLSAADQRPPTSSLYQLTNLKPTD